jgi:hypothetical protein
MLVMLGVGATALMFVGRDFFPLIDGGQIQLHVRAPPATRIETTKRIFQAVEDKIREVIPEQDRGLVIDNIGLPARTYNLAFVDGSTIGINDGVIQVALKEGHKPTADYIRKLRQVLPAATVAGGRRGTYLLFQDARQRPDGLLSQPAAAPGWMSASGGILLKKSFGGGERNFLDLLMRLVRSDVRDHVAFQKNDRRPAYWRYGASQRRSCPKISNCEIFRVIRFSTF